jgi:hypothetical protein
MTTVAGFHQRARIARFLLFLFACLPGAVPAGWAQSVAVTLQLGTNTLAVGEATLLHVYAQVLPGLRTTTDRIFSWYVDVLNTNAAAASANYAALVKPASDNDPLLSGTGVAQDANRRGIYDTFLNRPGAGTTNPVELITLPVAGVAAGATRFRVQAGTEVSGLSADFLVAPLGGGAALAGGVYTAAFADLQVVSTAACALDLNVIRQAGSQLLLTFAPCPGRTHTVQFSTALNPTPAWQPLPGGPHNSGSVTVTNTGQARFFRVLASLP